LRIPIIFREPLKTPIVSLFNLVEPAHPPARQNEEVGLE
jgi:hypothetical protein